MTIEAEISRLEDLGLDALRQAWSKGLGEPPKVASAEILRLMLAWRMQAELYGGLDEQTRRRLRQRPSQAGSLPVGSTIVRDWRGSRHEVAVTEEGFLFRGKVHRSLTAVATEITGVKWNGPKFFGVGEAVRK
jgi:hypothetical protein